MHGDKNYPWRSAFAGDLDIAVPDEVTEDQYLGYLVRSPVGPLLTPSSRVEHLKKLVYDCLKHPILYFFRLEWTHWLKIDSEGWVCHGGQ